MRISYFIVSLSYIFLFSDNVNAGWKFWKKKKDDDSTTTEDPGLSTSTTKLSVINPTTKAPMNKPVNEVPMDMSKTLIGAADPGLVLGVGGTEGRITNRAQPQKQNPGTEVGHDFLSRSKQDNEDYRKWAIDLTRAGDGQQLPKLLNQGPVVTSLGQPSQGYPSPAMKPGGTPAQTPKVGVQSPTPALKVSPTTATSISALKSGLLNPTQPSQIGSPKVNSDFPSLPSQFSRLETANTSSGSSSPVNEKSYSEATGSRSGSPNSGSNQNLMGKNQLQLSSTRKPGIATGAIGVATAGNPQPSSNPTFSKGNSVTNDDLEKLSEALFIKDTNNAMKYITLNLQKQTTGNNPVDEAPQPLLNVKSEALQSPTIKKVLAIYDNYQLDTRTNEYISPAQRQEESLLVDTFLSTNVMSYAMRFLADKEFVKKDYYEYKDLLRRLWFNLFSRGEGKIGSSGFEHVFMTELNLGTEVTGMHNWIYFNAEEVKKRVDYLGYIKKVDLGDKAAILKIHAKFNGFDKPVTTMFIGTSPEFEMALYTVCFLTRPDKSCSVSVKGTKFNIVTHKFKYRGKELIGSAYPDI